MSVSQTSWDQGHLRCLSDTLVSKLQEVWFRCQGSMLNTHTGASYLQALWETSEEDPESPFSSSIQDSISFSTWIRARTQTQITPMCLRPPTPNWWRNGLCLALRRRLEQLGLAFSLTSWTLAHGPCLSSQPQLTFLALARACPKLGSLLDLPLACPVLLLPASWWDNFTGEIRVH